MELHTNKLTAQDVRKAALLARVEVEELSRKGSRSHIDKYAVSLSGSSFHRPNSGRYGTTSQDVYAATWDEWGMFLGYLFALDPDAMTRNYANAEHFHWATGDRFNIEGPRLVHPDDQHRQHKWTFDGFSGGRQYSVMSCDNSTCNFVTRRLNGLTWAEFQMVNA